MKSKWKRLLLSLTTVLLFIGIGILYNRQDIRFVFGHMASTLFMEKAPLEEFMLADGDLYSLSIRDVASDNEDKQKVKITYNISLALINADNPIHHHITPNLVEYKDTGIIMDHSLVESYHLLSEAVMNHTKDHLYIRSSYRSNEEQTKLYAKDRQVASLPGTSEHETGLSLDVYVKHYAGRAFLKSEAGQFVQQNSWKYGFIIRYPMFKKKETGVPFEPWHIRYVGLPHAEIIYRNNITLETYIHRLEVGKFYTFEDYIISRQKGDDILIPHQLNDIVISPDNMGNYIITGKIK